ncbi:hypothetical protein Tco_0764211 [Tanacetum coccineum]
MEEFHEVADIFREDLLTNPLMYFNNDADEEEFDGEEDDEEGLLGVPGRPTIANDDQGMALFTYTRAWELFHLHPHLLCRTSQIWQVLRALKLKRPVFVEKKELI